ncbi:unnamed protein product [Rotaria sp. Silwood1]|nr:unnamed protein product [Rotaria sp. Silwood1]
MILVLIFIAVTLSMLYLKWKYFTTHSPIPSLSPQFLFGNLLQSGVLNGVSPPHILAAFKKRFGDVFQFWVGPSRFIIVNNIVDVEHIFTHRHIYDQGDIFIEKFSVSYPNSLISTKETLDGEDISKKNELLRALRDMISSIMPIIYLPTIVAKIYVTLSLRQRRARKVIERYIDKMIQHELAASSESVVQRKRTSLIASLVDALQNNQKLESIKSEEEKKGKMQNKRIRLKFTDHELSCFFSYLSIGLSRDEVLDEMVAFLVAGFESTSSTLAWFIHLMSKHPQVQQKIKTELMNDNNLQRLSLDRLDSLIYLDCVINEVFRFCPPTTGTIRTLTIDDRLPSSDVQLFKGESVLIPFHNLAHDARYWSIDPEIFYPERFLGEDKNHHPYALIPFGGGHRQCIGQELARFELKVIAARLMQYVTFGDGGIQVNAGGHSVGLAVIPKHVGVTIDVTE